MNEIQQRAAAFAKEHGLSVFPTRGKRPVEGVMWTRATTETDRWGDAWDRADGYGVVLEGVVVIDIDRMDRATVQSLPSVEESLTVKSPRGVHIYYYGELPQTYIGIADHVDIKTGSGSYVIGPGSETDNGRYELVRDIPIGQLDARWGEWISHNLAQREWDHPDADPIAVEHQAEGGRDNLLTSIAGSLRRRGMDEEEILATLRIRNQRVCDPPLPDGDLQRIARSAMRWEPDAEQMATDRELATTLERMDTDFMSIDDVLSRKPLPELISSVFPYGTVNVMYGAPGTFKSFIAMDWAVALSRGEPLRAMDMAADEESPWQVPEQKKVLYVAAEGIGGMSKRLAAGGERYRTSGLTIYAGAMNLSEPEIYTEFLSRIHNRFDVVFFDTFRKSMPGVDENSSTEVSEVMRRLEDWAVANNIISVLIHHSNRSELGGYRGSSAIEGDAYNMWKVERVEGQLMSRVTTEKFKDAEPMTITASLEPWSGMLHEREASSLVVMGYAEEVGQDEDVPVAGGQTIDGDTALLARIAADLTANPGTTQTACAERMTQHTRLSLRAIQTKVRNVQILLGLRELS